MIRDTVAEVNEKVKALLGYSVDYVKTTNGLWVAEWMNFNSSPPPTAPTKEEAAEQFLAFLQTIVQASPDVAVATDQEK